MSTPNTALPDPGVPQPGPRSSYPVRVNAVLEEPLSRWLWLVKFILLIPHFIILVFLWIGFLVATVIAFFAIVFTGRYPRGLFDFNVGVLRWNWRVSYYFLFALGTDRYPPFSLEANADYPAELDVDYPEHLSRGLVWVKAWLLAIPHYLVVAILLGAGAFTVWPFWPDDDYPFGGGGLVTLLVLIAAVALLFTGRYPRSIFDFVMGLNRWGLRVAGYAALMTDVYPPFRLDQGGADPGGAAIGAEPLPVVAEHPAAQAPGGPPLRPVSGGSAWTARRVVAIVIGALMTLVSFACLGTGIAALVVGEIARDDDGYLTSPERNLTTSGYALVSDEVDLEDTDGPDAFSADEFLGDLRIRVTSVDPASRIFIGIASLPDVQAYLDGVAHDVVSDISGDRTTYSSQPGDAPDGPPTAQDIWLVSSQGAGTQSVQWPFREGEWAVVVMNADGSAGVDVEADIGATVPWLDTFGWVFAGIGLLLLIGGITLVYVGARHHTPAPPTPPPTTPSSPAEEPGPGDNRPAPTA